MNGNVNRKSIKAMDLLGVYFRSFLIQASWSFDRMQSLGFAYAMIPALRRVYPDPEEYRTRLILHMEYFNTQPYLASFILGAAVRMEEERASGQSRAIDVSALKNTLMGPMGALGDSFFWGALKPLSVLIAVAALMSGVWWAPLLFLVLYNSWHVWLRTELLVWGYRSAGDVVSLVARYRFTRIARLFKAVALCVLGGMLGMIPVWRPEFKPAVPVPGAIAAGAGLLITFVLAAALKKGGSPIKLMLGLAAICTALAYAGVA
jgi:PTS system mannose-specific IID component